MNNQEQLWGTNPTRNELLAAITLFIVPVIGYLLAAIPNQIISPKFGYVLLGILALGLLYGAWKNFPTWSLPYLGCFVSIFAFLKSIQYLGELLSPHILNLIGPRPWSMIDRLVLQFIWNGISWVFLFSLTNSAGDITRAYPPLSNTPGTHCTGLDFTLIHLIRRDDFEPGSVVR